MTDLYPRGICCHEAGHAVVAWSHGVTVKTVRVFCDDAKGWCGGTDHNEGGAGHLNCEDQITILVAGKAAEKFFDCPAHLAWLRDFGEISSLLDRGGIPLREVWRRIDEGSERARAILVEHQEPALKLIDHLVEHGRVDTAEFLRLMDGRMP